MAYHVSFSPADGKIYAGTVNKKGDKWINRSEVTEEALASVREHLLAVMAVQEDKPEIVGYQWKLTDGRPITLQLTIGKLEEKEEKE